MYGENFTERDMFAYALTCIYYAAEAGGSIDLLKCSEMPPFDGFPAGTVFEYHYLTEFGEVQHDIDFEEKPTQMFTLNKKGKMIGDLLIKAHSLAFKNPPNYVQISEWVKHANIIKENEMKSESMLVFVDKDTFYNSNIN